ncbi:Hypothetical protein A7982_08570 [Minicystis rosea]|nr:Hypothetical protein A7982_08570 [Minicystis rosea]
MILNRTARPQDGRPAARFSCGKWLCRKRFQRKDAKTRRREKARRVGVSSRAPRGARNG